VIGGIPLILQIGDEGELVKAVQNGILGLGYSLTIYGADGIYGKLTEIVVKRLQTDAELEATGVIDDLTMSYIITKLAVNPKLTKAKRLARQIAEL